MKVEKYLEGLRLANDYFSGIYGYEIVILDEDLLRKVFSMVEKIRKKIALKHYNLVVVSLYFDLGGKNTLLIKFTRKYKSLIFERFVKQNFSTDENKISVFISLTKNKTYREWAFRDVEVIKEILDYYKIDKYRQTSTPYSEIIEFSIPLKGEVIKYIIWRPLDS